MPLPSCEGKRRMPAAPREPRQGHAELVAAVAAERAEGVAGETLRVQAREDVALPEDVAVDQRDVLLAVAVVPERDDAEPAEPGG